MEDFEGFEVLKNVECVCLVVYYVLVVDIGC